LNIGYELVNKVLTEGIIIPLLDAGFNRQWLEGVGTGNEVIFTGIDRQAYQWILTHWKRHKKVPEVDLFREHYPVSTYKLAPTSTTLDQLIELAVDKVNSFLVAELIGKTIDLHDIGDYDTAISLLKTESARLNTDLRFRRARADVLNDGTFDIDALLNREVSEGLPFGIHPIDEEFYGFQQGQLITIMGRQKAGKTTFTLNSALSVWQAGYTPLIFSVEMDTDMLRQKLYCLGSHVSHSRMRRGRLRDSEKDKVREFHNELVADEEASIIISKKKSLITVEDIRDEIRLYNPAIVYIDGFDFMVDKNTGKMTRDWQANEFVANELKAIALEEEVTIVVNTQVQEKQYSPKFGIEARTIAAGTGLLKASDLVIGADLTDRQHTLNCVLSRYEYFEPVVIEIDWDTTNIYVLETSSRKLENRGI